MSQIEKKRQPATMTRRVFLKKSGVAAFAFLGLSALPFYSYFAERHWLETVSLELPFRSLPSSFDGLKIVHFSDVHYGFYYDLPQLQSLIDHIMKLQPDLIVFTGDLFDAEVLPYAKDIIHELRRLKAPLGQYAVPGNHDYYTGRKHAINVFEESGFQMMHNRSKTLTVKRQRIQLVGVDDMINGRPDLDAAFAGLDNNRFTLFLAHEPDFATQTSPYRVDLQLSGHTHGGQLRLPFTGPLMTVVGGRKYVQGLYKLPNRSTDSYVYTTRGIGTTHIPVRFLCRPELTVIHLKHQT